MRPEDIRTLDDALRYNGVTIDQYKAQTNGLPEDVRAFIALRYIVRALNDGWEPTFNGAESRVFVWYDFLPDLAYRQLPKLQHEWPIEGRCGTNPNYHHGIARVTIERNPMDQGTICMMGCNPFALAFRDEQTARYAAAQFSEAFLTLYFGPQRSITQ